MIGSDCSVLLIIISQNDSQLENNNSNINSWNYHPNGERKPQILCLGNNNN
jgi:hypothetical protein